MTHVSSSPMCNFSVYAPLLFFHLIPLTSFFPHIFLNLIIEFYLIIFFKKKYENIYYKTVSS